MSTLRRDVLPRQAAYQRDEPHRPQILVHKPAVGPADTHQLLVVMIGPNRRHQHPARRQPVDQGRWNLRGRGGHNNTVVGQLLRPALGAVAESVDDIAQTERIETALSPAQQLAMTLDRKYPAGEARQDRGLIPRAGANLDDVVPVADQKRLGHQRDYIGLADRLSVIDRQRDVFIGLVGESQRYEFLARRLLDRAQHPEIANPGAPQLHQQPQLLLQEAGLGPVLNREGLSHGVRSASDLPYRVAMPPGSTRCRPRAGSSRGSRSRCGRPPGPNRSRYGPAASPCLRPGDSAPSSATPGTGRSSSNSKSRDKCPAPAATLRCHRSSAPQTPYRLMAAA